MKEIKGIGFTIPSENDDYLKIDSNSSLSETDIAIFCPNLNTTGYSCCNNDGYNGKHEEYQGKKLYNKESSAKILEHIKHWNKELLNFVEKGGTLFVILCEKQDFFVYTGTKDISGTGRNQKTTNHVSPLTNFDYLPFPKIEYHSASGKNIFTDSPIYKNLVNQFEDFFSFETYLISDKITIPSFTTKKKDRILGATLKLKEGNLIYLPNLSLDIPAYTDYKEETDEDIWTKEAIVKGKILIQSIIEIEKVLLQKNQKSPKPNWIYEKQYELLESNNTKKIIEKNKAEIIKRQKENENLNLVLEEQESLKDLLFETGKPLEDAVIFALRILGYSAENFDDGELELDQIINSPEGNRYIGECEGKENKDIDVSKFRQLLDGLNADFEKETVEEKAFGILFGNPQRLIELNKRNLDFTNKCKIGAKRENIGLINTPDLFKVSRYVKESNDLEFAKLCRLEIHKQLGNVIIFPEIK
jgi:hypothetical protein